MLRFMVYTKNVPIWERVLRILAGVVMGGYIAVGQPSTPLVVVLLFSAIFVIVTGFVGFCPMCALVGRKIK